MVAAILFCEIATLPVYHVYYQRKTSRQSRIFKKVVVWLELCGFPAKN